MQHFIAETLTKYLLNESRTYEKIYTEKLSVERDLDRSKHGYDYGEC